MTEAALKDIIKNRAPDLLFVDSQHQPLNEEKLLAFCGMANRLGSAVILRLKNTNYASLSGNFLDHGPLAILVPQTDSIETVDEAIEAFFYPPVGRRSWGPPGAFGFNDHPGRREFADWWNANGILAIQIETLNAVLNIRKFAKPGVSLVMFGANDLMFDLETFEDPPLKTVEECIEHVKKELKGLKIGIAAGMTPCGDF